MGLGQAKQAGEISPAAYLLITSNYFLIM